MTARSVCIEFEYRTSFSKQKDVQRWTGVVARPEYATLLVRNGFSRAVEKIRPYLGTAGPRPENQREVSDILADILQDGAT